ncbi:hypothetical protein [Kluyvera ascorbata]|nr:hypothetical protein [Kluyvera ascorbata]MDU1196582.1 hypothetical protein [Kluyvera ascorbata]
MKKWNIVILSTLLASGTAMAGGNDWTPPSSGSGVSIPHVGFTTPTKPVLPAAGKWDGVVHIYQAGSNNDSYASQTGASGSTIDVHQNGDWGRSTVNQIATKSATVVNQYGTGNQSYATQAGSGNSIAVTQSGTSNASTTLQAGTGNAINVAQSGNNNSSYIDQKGKNSSVDVTQVDYRNSSTVN